MHAPTRESEFAELAALVTGGSGGIGAAICRALADRGAAVAVAYGGRARAAEQVASEIAAAGGTAQAFTADMEDPQAPAELVRHVENALGPVGVLVANHGHARQAAYDEVDAEAFDRTLAINLRAPFLLAKAVLPGMRERGFGRILFVSSVAAFRGGVIGPDYAASKSGLHGLTHFLASRTAQDGVTVNALAPGFIDTTMLPGSAEDLSASVPVGRVGRPEEAAELAVAILSNGYLTNQVLSLDGGMHPR
jgi:3-oxoacyl-[acyl-carrier protein] reductase